MVAEDLGERWLLAVELGRHHLGLDTSLGWAWRGSIAVLVLVFVVAAVEI